MSEYFITARSFAGLFSPFWSDTSERYVEANSPRDALEKFARDYSHPCGLYAAECWSSAAFRKKALCAWESNDLQAEKRATMGKGAFIRERRADGLYIDDQKVIVHGDPREGSVV